MTTEPKQDRPSHAVLSTVGLGAPESCITINDITLTDAQAMTVRVAVTSFAMELRAVGLGDDERGKAIAGGYLARLDEIFNLMLNVEGSGASASARPQS